VGVGGGGADAMTRLRSLVPVVPVVLALQVEPPPEPAPPAPERPSAAAAPAPDRPRSVPLGRPNAGRLRHGVPFPAVGPAHLTWDPVLDRIPNRDRRRWATDRTVNRTLRVLAEFRAANPGAPPVLVGDLSRPAGGVFDRRFGGLGHASHQNGLDVDVYYPRRDRRLRAPWKPEQVDRALAADLRDGFRAAGARFVFVGPRLALDDDGPGRTVVQELVHHDDHLHVRFDP